MENVITTKILNSDRYHNFLMNYSKLVGIPSNSELDNMPEIKESHANALSAIESLIKLFGIKNVNAALETAGFKPYIMKYRFPSIKWSLLSDSKIKHTKMKNANDINEKSET